MDRVAVAKDKPKDCMEDRVILRPRKLDCGPPQKVQLKTAPQAVSRIVLKNRREGRAKQREGNRVED